MYRGIRLSTWVRAVSSYIVLINNTVHTTSVEPCSVRRNKSRCKAIAYACTSVIHCVFRHRFLLMHRIILSHIPNFDKSVTIRSYILNHFPFLIATIWKRGLLFRNIIYPSPAAHDINV